jgi:hypothetical protein
MRGDVAPFGQRAIDAIVQIGSIAPQAFDPRGQLAGERG